MTKITILKKCGRVVGYKSTGHTGYSQGGNDIVCASLSTILQTPIIAMQNILGLNPKIVVKDGYLDVKIVGSDNRLDILLDSMALMISELSKQYPKNIKLVVKEEN